jgi:hypothetical protein
MSFQGFLQTHGITHFKQICFNQMEKSNLFVIISLNTAVCKAGVIIIIQLILKNCLRQLCLVQLLHYAICTYTLEGLSLVTRVDST